MLYKYLLCLLIFIVNTSESIKNIPQTTRNDQINSFNRVLRGSLILSTIISMDSTKNNVAIASSNIIKNNNELYKNNNDLISGFLSGTVSRASKEILLHPFDTIRARLQVMKQNETIDGLYDNLYEGLVPALVGGIPASGVFFSIKDYTKNRLKNIGLNKQQATIISVAAANIPYWLIKTPAEVIKTRQQINSNDTSLILFQKIIEEKGAIDGLNIIYSSYFSNFAYALPADILKFLAYEYLTLMIYHKDDKEKLNPFEASFTGALASLLSQSMTTPLDVVRTRIMENKNNNSNMISTIKSIIDDEGLNKLFAGTIPRGVRSLASGAIQFASLEMTNNYFK